MKSIETVETWHSKWRMLPADTGGGAVIECVDCERQSLFHHAADPFIHAFGCSVADDMPQYPWDDLRVALARPGRTTARSALDVT